MSLSSDFLEKITFPYYARRQAQIAPPLPSIAWNRLALSGYCDALIQLKGTASPATYPRRIRLFYELYEKAAEISPDLGKLDLLERNLSKLDRLPAEALINAALEWNQTAAALEGFCLDRLRGQKYTNEQLVEVIQSYMYKFLAESAIPQFTDYLSRFEEELQQVAKLKNYPPAAMVKLNINHRFFGTLHTDRPEVRDRIAGDPELTAMVNELNRSFFRLVNEINWKLPESGRSLKADPSRQNLSSLHDFRLVLSYFYDAEEEIEYQSGFFSKLRDVFKWNSGGASSSK
jgi:hypothetical protein